MLDPSIIKGAWTSEEDASLVTLVGAHGLKAWSTVAQGIPGRLGKQCRERWRNHVDPDIVRTTW